MVAMQMGDQDRVDRIRIDAELLHGDQRGGAAVDEEAGGRARHHEAGIEAAAAAESVAAAEKLKLHARSEEHTSELQSLMRISYAVFCLKKKKKKHKYNELKRPTQDEESSDDLKPTNTTKD